MKQINKYYIIIIINTIPSIERIYTQRTFLNSITILLFIKIMIHTRISSKSKFECKNLYVLKNTFYQHQTLALIYQAKRIVYSYMLRSLLVRRIKVHHFRHFVVRLFFLFFFFFLNEFLVPRQVDTPRMQQRLGILVEWGNRNFFSKCVPRRVFKWHALSTGRRDSFWFNAGNPSASGEIALHRARFPMEIQSPEHQLGNSSQAQSFCLLNRHSWDARINPFATPRCYSTVIFIPDYKQCLKFMLA